MQEIDRKLLSFKENLERKCLSDAEKNAYFALYARILKADQMPEEELIDRAKRIKPLVRLDKHGTSRCCGEPEPGDQLVFVKPTDIRQSYLFNFEKKHIVMPVKLEDLEEVARFTCYHRYGGCYAFFRPGVDEVLSQIPPGVDLDQVSAFEIHVDSLSVGEVFDAILNRHVTTVILYKITHGLPRRIARQKVNCDDQKY